MDQITEGLEGVDITEVADLFKCRPSDISWPWGRVNLLIGIQGGSLFPREHIWRGDLILLRSQFSSRMLLQGAHPSIKPASGQLTTGAQNLTRQAYSVVRGLQTLPSELTSAGRWQGDPGAKRRTARESVVPVSCHQEGLSSSSHPRERWLTTHSLKMTLQRNKIIMAPSHAVFVVQRQDVESIGQDDGEDDLHCISNLRRTEVMPLNRIADLENVCCKPVRDLLAVDSQNTMHPMLRLEYRMICQDSTTTVHSMTRPDCIIYPLHCTIRSEHKAISSPLQFGSLVIGGAEECNGILHEIEDVNSMQWSQEKNPEEIPAGIIHRTSPSTNYRDMWRTKRLAISPIYSVCRWKDQEVVLQKLMKGLIEVAHLTAADLQGVWHKLTKSIMAWDLQYVMHKLSQLEYVISTVHSMSKFEENEDLCWICYYIALHSAMGVVVCIGRKYQLIETIGQENLLIIEMYGI